ncbi:aspartyl-phosphate phosphatase Spo0E family protein [Metabacillus fastidiosus]|uniref:Aspartyl-phosphate phosphatase Spo0E family protein n=1 Tax=Metabacillus fastidiosus TaxID=1458 RepID=A0ABU6P1T2_9BACI|nr:aspartyl-phosphate phosphatase Spo0E family protein [Metabacillus fastidiosus]MED4402474.1 aspartyl-phosphate phosphatase Spo0E family protein [Metabacillus fastidiosus]MED4453825.1 aspartyl-phosphate phosphatase Spo0E family protein [Metabacillus fastidiosus]MED4461761.1 aspartyl-phosphate phosphatase Spo0E family protein [Metabacillus fastidiosus]MED4531165.1 aspartyl-phosphate phosphatase Spo0E family protein [Metabacillus fastidiosus]
MQIQDVTLNNLEDAIQSLRSQMIAAGMQKGLNHPDTISYSQQLDVLLNKYQCLMLHQEND